MPHGSTIPGLVLAAADRHGDRTAVEDGSLKRTFAELGDDAVRAARAFCAAGIRPGDRIGIWAPNLYEWILAAIALQSVGAVLVPLNTRLKGREAGYILRRSRARLLCTVDTFLGTRYVELLREALGGASGRPVAGLPDLERVVVLRPGEDAKRGDGVEEPVAWEDFLAAAESVPEAEALRRIDRVSPEDLSDILFTSGTTGSPKGVMTTHGQNLRCFETWSGIVGLRREDRYLIVNPFFHAFGYKAGWLSSILRGATLLPHAVFDVPAVLERIARDRITVLPGPPTLYQSLLAHADRDRYDLSSLRLAVTGAAVIPVDLVRRMRRDLGFETVITGYGLTECSGVVTMCRQEDDPETIATTSGRAIPDVEVRCVDGEGKEVPRGRPGEVVVRGYNVMRGYLDDPEETAAALDTDGWLHTGDVGIMDERGYLRITDRIKDLFIVGGFNCYPAEIENLLLGCPGVAQVAVIGVPDERLGEVGMAFVVPSPGIELTAERIVSWSRENMANFKVPRRVEILDALPVNATGKVTKFVLRERARAALRR